MEFPDLGSHCSVPDCRQLDFLPFSCKCGGKFCLEHRLPIQHNCAVRSDDQLVPTVVVLCPICSKSYKLYTFEDPNQVINAHMRQDNCTLKLTQPVKKCAKKGCQVSAPNSLIDCAFCGKTVCLS
jgi:hypothetical protein